VLVVLQVALSLVLVTGTGLFVRSFQNLLDVDLGFERERLITVRIDPNLSGTKAEDLPGMYQRTLDAVAAVPGIHSASLGMCALQSNCARMDGFEIEGYPSRPGELVLFSVNTVTPGYFSTVGMPLIGGRTLNERDLANTPKTAVVNRALAAKYFGEWQRAIGRHFGLQTLDTEIVGVVENPRTFNNVKEAAVPAMFMPLSQRPVVMRALEVRTLVDPATAIAAVRRAVHTAAPDLPIERIETVEQRVRSGFSKERLLMLLTSGFGALALGLAGVGLFGVLSYTVARRTPEYGLRMALGASRTHVLGRVVRDALWLVVPGILLGLPCVFLVGRFMSALVFGISPHDGPSLAGAVAVLLAIGAACGVIPALRAARVDPIVALREE
jgi:predicted permease